ncbi:MAG TPA: MAPEG family protein [Polyangiales bacterium]|nr:MAPEG family protein [Polyangiales bacterium]
MTPVEWLAASAVLTALLWIPYVLERMVSLGIVGTLKPVDPEDELKQRLWARRAKRAHYNAVENLVVFATLVLVAQTMGQGEDAQVLFATQSYFWARVVHFPALTMGWTGIRTLAFLATFAAQVMVALRIFVG